MGWRLGTGSRGKVTWWSDQFYMVGRKQRVETDSFLLTWKAKYSFAFWELRVFKIGINLEDIILHVC